MSYPKRSLIHRRVPVRRAVWYLLCMAAGGALVVVANLPGCPL